MMTVYSRRVWMWMNVFCLKVPDLHAALSIDALLEVGNAACQVPMMMMSMA